MYDMVNIQIIYIMCVYIYIYVYIYVMECKGPKPVSSKGNQS